MKRPFRGFEVVGLAAALASGAACAPSNSVKSGAPVLIEVSIVEGGGATITSIPPGAAACPAGTAGRWHVPHERGPPGQHLLPRQELVPLRGRTWRRRCRCRRRTARTAAWPARAAQRRGRRCRWCGRRRSRCAPAVPLAPTLARLPTPRRTLLPPPDGIWNCDPFSPTAQALLHLRPPARHAPVRRGRGRFRGGHGDRRADRGRGRRDDRLHAQRYAERACFSAARRSELARVGRPRRCPPASAATIALNPMAVRAKDGKTPFTDNDNFGGGVLTFTTAGLTATVTPPAPPPLPADAGACATPNTDVALDAPATITFNSPVDPPPCWRGRDRHRRRRPARR